MEETDLLERLVVPEENSGINPLPDLRESEGDGDETQPVRDGLTKETLVISEVTVEVHMKSGNTENKSRIDTQKTMVPNSKLLDEFHRLGLDVREDEENADEVSEDTAPSCNHGEISTDAVCLTSVGHDEV